MSLKKNTIRKRACFIAVHIIPLIYLNQSVATKRTTFFCAQIFLDMCTRTSVSVSMINTTAPELFQIWKVFYHMDIYLLRCSTSKMSRNRNFIGLGQNKYVRSPPTFLYVTMSDLRWALILRKIFSWYNNFISFGLTSKKNTGLLTSLVATSLLCYNF